MGEPFPGLLAVGEVEGEFVEVDVFEAEGWRWEFGSGFVDEERGFGFEEREWWERFGLVGLTFHAWVVGGLVWRRAW